MITLTIILVLIKIKPEFGVICQSIETYDSSNNMIKFYSELLMKNFDSNYLYTFRMWKKLKKLKKLASSNHKQAKPFKWNRRTVESYQINKKFKEEYAN